MALDPLVDLMFLLALLFSPLKKVHPSPADTVLLGVWNFYQKHIPLQTCISLSRSL